MLSLDHLPATNDAITTLGLALFAAFMLGKLAHRFSVPKVTGYVVAGVLLGPSLFNIVSEEMAALFRFIQDMALGLILFNIGGQFHRQLFRKVGLRSIKYSLLYAFFIFVIVSGGLFLGLHFLSDLSNVNAIAVSIFLGVVSIAAAPPTTLMVIKEYDSKGPVTNHIIVFLAVGTVLSIVGAKVLVILYGGIGLWPIQSMGLGLQIFQLVWSIVGAILIGVLLGFGLSYWEQHEREQSEILLGVICSILLGLTLAHWLALEPMLVSMALGFSLVNSSHSGNKIHLSIKKMGTSIYALFFVMAGAHINVIKDFKLVGFVVLIYIIARMLGFLIASRISTKLTQNSKTVGKQLGWCLLAHAGAAIGMVASLEHIHHPVANTIVHVVFASVVFFELSGPLLLKMGLIKAGEVKVGTMVGGFMSSQSFTIYEMFNHFLNNIGVKFNSNTNNKVETVAPLINRKVLAIKSNMDFQHVVKFIDSHHYPLYPVVNAENDLEGVISLDEFKNVMFDPFLSRLILAQDLIGHHHYLKEDWSLLDASGLFKKTEMEFLPVIHPESGKYRGIAYQKDILMALKRQNDNA